MAANLRRLPNDEIMAMVTDADIETLKRRRASARVRALAARAAYENAEDELALIESEINEWCTEVRKEVLHA